MIQLTIHNWYAAYCWYRCRNEIQLQFHQVQSKFHRSKNSSIPHEMLFFLVIHKVEECINGWYIALLYSFIFIQNFSSRICLGTIRHGQLLCFHAMWNWSYIFFFLIFTGIWLPKLQRLSWIFCCWPFDYGWWEINETFSPFSMFTSQSRTLQTILEGLADFRSTEQMEIFY